MTVTAVNDPPQPQDDAGITDEDQAKTFTSAELVGNDEPGPTAPAGTADNEQSQVLTVVGTSATSVQGGAVTLSGGVITYTPPADYFGEDAFTYRVQDNGSPPRESEGTVTVTVVPGNDVPRAASDSYQVTENSPLAIGGMGVLGNDISPDGRPLTVSPRTLVTDRGAAVQIAADGTFRYDPTRSLPLRVMDAEESYQDSFQYQITDDVGGTSAATVWVTVLGVTDPPYHNPVISGDVNGDSQVGAIDALILVNMVNRNGVGPVPAGLAKSVFVDVNADGVVSAADVLSVINDVNARVAGGGEGEAVGEPSPPTAGNGAAAPVTATAPPAPSTYRDPGLDKRPLATESSHSVESTERPQPVVDSQVETVSGETLFDDLDVDDAGLDDALSDIFDAERSGVGETSTDELFGLLFR